MKKNIIGIGLLVLATVILFYYLAPGSNDNNESDSSLSKIKERGTLIVGISMPYGVMEFLDESGNPDGIDVQVARELAKAIGVEIKFIDYSWDNLFTAFKSGDVDLAVSSISITAERAQEMLFSAPYFVSGQTLITQKTNSDIFTTNDLENKRVSVQEGTTAEAGVGSLSNNIQVTSFISGPEVAQALVDGRVDAAISDYIEAITFVKENPSLELRGDTFSQEFYGIATKLGNVALITEVDKILREMKRNGTMTAIERSFKD